MAQYETVLKIWQGWNIRSVSDLELHLDSFRILFAYHSGKIENEHITYHDTREIFENGQVVGYTGDTRTLFELQNQKVCYDFLKSKMIEREPLSIPLILEVHRILTAGAYDERRYIVHGERPGEFKKTNAPIMRPYRNMTSRKPLTSWSLFWKNRRLRPGITL